jgi:hypothetical protein
MRDLTPTKEAMLVEGFESGLDNPEDANFDGQKFRSPQAMP